MLKQSIIIFTIFLGTLTFAQEKPSEQIEVTQHDSLATTEESVDSSTVDSVALQIWNKVCPVMGNKVDVDGPTVEYNGKLYAFCCPGCDAKFEKNPEKYSKNLSDDGTKFIGRK
jgi:YHS domain-containing protein